MWVRSKSVDDTQTPLHATSPGPGVYHQVPSAGHNPPQEAPDAYARTWQIFDHTPRSVMRLTRLARRDFQDDATPGRLSARRTRPTSLPRPATGPSTVARGKRDAELCRCATHAVSLQKQPGMMSLVKVRTAGVAGSLSRLRRP